MGHGRDCKSVRKDGPLKNPPTPGEADSHLERTKLGLYSHKINSKRARFQVNSKTTKPRKKKTTWKKFLYQPELRPS